MPAIKDNFTGEEWGALRDAPHLIGMATALSGASGMFGTLGEMFTSARAVYEGNTGPNELIRTLASKEEMEATKETLKAAAKSVSPGQAKEDLQAMALSRARAAMAALQAKAPAETGAYRQWIYEIAQKVAESSKEGGFLGFGGERVSEGEREFLDRLRAAV